MSCTWVLITSCRSAGRGWHGLIAIIANNIWGFGMTTDLRWDSYCASLLSAPASSGMQCTKHVVPSQELEHHLCTSVTLRTIQKSCAAVGVTFERNCDQPGFSPEKSWPLCLRYLGTIKTKIQLFSEPGRFLNRRTAGRTGTSKQRQPESSFSSMSRQTFKT